MPNPHVGLLRVENTSGGKQPWYFIARDGSPILTAAGLWDEWKNRETGERMMSCAMIITEPNGFTRASPRPYAGLLDGGAICAVASGEAGAGILKPVADDFLQRWPVSKRVNSSKADADDPALIENIELAAA